MASKGATVKDIPAQEFIIALAQHFKKSQKLELPEWHDIVKTGTFKELAPINPDWYYIRAASVIRKVYLKQGLGVGALTTIYGGSNSKKKVDLITCGLDNSGKSTIINHLKPSKHKEEQLAPTVGYQVESFSKGQVNFKVFDMGGAKKFRNLWEHYYHDVQGVIFVIDTADKIRIVLVKDELQLLIANKELQGLPILFFANKMDIPGALTPHEVAESLNERFVGGKLHSPLPPGPNIIASNALSGHGIEEGINWLSGAILKEDRK